MPSNQRGVVHVFLLLLLLIGIAVGVYLVQNRTNIFPHASVSDPVNPRTAYSFLFFNTNPVQVGQIINVGVMASTDFDASNTFTAKVVYKADKLQAIEVRPIPTDSAGLNYFPTKWIEQTILPPDANGYGAVIMSGVVPNPGYKTTAGKPGIMASIVFKALSPGTTNLGFDFDQSAIYRNSDNQNILANTDGLVVVIEPAGSGIPTVDTDKDGFLDGDELFFGTDPVKACGVNAWPPDVNDDTFVNGSDVSFMVPFVDGSKPYNKRYDFDRNGQITQFDVSIMQKYFLQTCSNTTAVCGNGVVESGESCDNGSSNGLCPKSCGSSCQPNACPTPSFPPVCTTTALSKTSVVSSASSVVWTYTYPDSTKIISVNFPAKAGLSYSMNGQSSVSGQGLNVNLGSGSSQIIFKVATDMACAPFTASFTMTNNCGTQMPDFVGIGSASGWGPVCNPSPPPSSPPVPGACNAVCASDVTCASAKDGCTTCVSGVCKPPAVIDGKRADLYKDTKKPGFVNDQDVSVFYSKCAEKGIELFGQPASVQPICDIFEDGKITVQDWSVLLKFRNQQT